MSALLGIIFGGFLAYANGANDNFKGVATLFGSETTSYKKALLWATVTTGIGSLTAVYLAQGLLITFSGKGLVPETVVSLQSYPVSVALAAACTVMLATQFGFPISTTHALTGALVGAGLVASETGVDFSRLLTVFLLPLMISPVIAVFATFILYPLFRRARECLGVEKETCLCLGSEVIGVVPSGGDPEAALMAFTAEMPTPSMGSVAFCRERYVGDFVGVEAETLLDRFHFLSAGIVGFARGLNDTPKIAALLLAGSVVDPKFAILGVGTLIALGGLINAKKVADTMSHGITKMNHGQGFTANLITGIVVIGASKFGVPVSTTHVSCGSLFGIGAVTSQADYKTISNILLAWIITLPVAAFLGALVMRLLES